MFGVSVREERENSVSFHEAVFDRSVFSQDLFYFFEYFLTDAFPACRQIKIKIHRKAGKAVEKISAGSTLESQKGSDRDIGINIPQDLPHYELVFFFVKHIFRDIPQAF
jgi:hypothetical protein